MKPQIRLGGLITILFTLLISSTYAQEVDITIVQKGLSQIKTGISEFVPTERADRDLENKLTQVLISDLTLVDYFEPIKSTTGVELLLKCSYTKTSSDQLTIEGKLYETKKGQMLLGKRFSGTTTQYRKLIHSLTDNIVSSVFGGKGIAQTKLTFEGTVNGEKQIFVSDYDGANIIQLTKDPCPSLFPNFSPTGDKIVYTSYLYNFPQTFIYNIKAGSRNKICGFPGLNTSASFSPDGRKIALTLSKDGNPEIYIINTDGSGLTRVTNDKSVDTSPCWSPDGNKLAFVSNRSGTPQIYIIDTRGGIPKRLTYTGSYNTNPCWSTNDNMIVYNTQIGSTFQICTVDVNTAQSEQITNSPNSCECPSFAPDGRHIVFSMTKGYNSSLYIMEIFFREPHKLEMSAIGVRRGGASGGKGGNYTNPDWGR